MPTGVVRWRVATPSTIFGSPTVAADGAIYFGSDQLHVLNPDGTKRWDFAGLEDDPIGYTDVPVLGPDGTVYVTRFSFDARAQRLYAVNPDGTLRWSIQGPYVHSTSIGQDGSILVLFEAGGLASFNADGIPHWQRAVDSFVYSPPAVATNGTLIIASGFAVHAFSSAGTPLWRFEGGPTSGGPVIGPDSTFYNVFTSGRVVALSS